MQCVIFYNTLPQNKTAFYFHSQIFSLQDAFVLPKKSCRHLLDYHTKNQEWNLSHAAFNLNLTFLPVHTDSKMFW